MGNKLNDTTGTLPNDKGVNSPKRLAILNMYAPNNRDSNTQGKTHKPARREKKKKNISNTHPKIHIQYYSWRIQHPLSVTDRLSWQKIITA